MCERDYDYYQQLVNAAAQQRSNWDQPSRCTHNHTTEDLRTAVTRHVVVFVALCAVIGYVINIVA